MEKEVLALEAECESCNNVYNLDDDLADADWNKTIPQVLTEKYGSDKLLCAKCRGILRITEEGTFKFITTKKGKKTVKDLVLITKEKERKVMRVKQSFDFE